MEQTVTILKQISGLLWGWPALILIAGTGIYLTLVLGFLPLRQLGFGFRQMLGPQRGVGTIGAGAALATSLSATIGTGNIVGVATAIHSGGPGALVWMWLIALVGMATKYAEAVLAVHFREKDAAGQYVGGPMYYIKNGLGKNWHWLAIAFAVFGMIAGFGIGNSVQANSVAHGLSDSFGLPPWITGVTLAVLVAMVVLGGMKRIATVATFIVPFMALAYLLAGLVVLADHANAIPGALALCFESAFTGTAAAGGFAGALVKEAIRFGMARGIFSNEAGLGSAPIAHASANTDHPARQGSIAMLGTFIDTIIVCSVTGLAIVSTGVWDSGVKGAPLSALAFSSTFGSAGNIIVACSLAVFAFTTLLGWSLYSERCTQFLFGNKAIMPFRIVWVLAIPLGALVSLNFVWALADIMNILMAVPNLIALLLLSPIVVRLSREFFANRPD
ncbi:MAG: sodium:alanine symporter [Alcanivorax borkumensis]|jgi:AGCS family alanine or glycine:cation symporter|uniref:Sodium/alanine symporter n=1 Tax=Alcanivorax borkumensis (strain ATCC 700651 / DSM 11573 / NCIMB 13689 / SK2) TaxID=393595 RepID=Q0VRY2_ALCBS|nr:MULTISPECIES: sodium:alanine symporter family protein [Alcanivorax]OJH07950.1 MAG: sodium:alanine symporter [Alcanivorax borkumensis]EUC70148.1 sodium:alanine symporter [Alcanivorax sp. 97CO-5]PKG01928.1 sodium:alanine symporter family protein [Alcanivorax sp. 97CO-6]CAL16066.1 sodium/alanine symporter [Alcanivorax borkumensis SK2]BAP13486.1 sodium/alanine symporter [Alcanivorax sp. NBRC 101098]